MRGGRDEGGAEGTHPQGAPGHIKCREATHLCINMHARKVHGCTLFLTGLCGCVAPMMRLGANDIHHRVLQEARVKTRTPSAYCARGCCGGKCRAWQHVAGARHRAALQDLWRAAPVLAPSAGSAAKPAVMTKQKNSTERNHSRNMCKRDTCICHTSIFRNEHLNCLGCSDCWCQCCWW